MRTKKLYELAKTISSNNKSQESKTLDIIFNEQSHYVLVKQRRVLTVESIAA